MATNCCGHKKRPSSSPFSKLIQISESVSEKSKKAMPRRHKDTKKHKEYGVFLLVNLGVFVPWWQEKPLLRQPLRKPVAFRSTVWYDGINKMLHQFIARRVYVFIDVENVFY
jgi:hypothetical protein